MKWGLAVLFSAALATSAAVSVQAQPAKCERSCTSLRNGCVKLGATKQACSAGYAHCLATGTYSMPSGRTWTNICRK